MLVAYIRISCPVHVRKSDSFAHSIRMFPEKSLPVPVVELTLLNFVEEPSVAYKKTLHLVTTFLGT